ncbi:hypothetical protein BKA70DRAFT_1475013 [Coprinopsis sp. MPI-PUGE-AT-0042]|nr:hypothetical protein BKA70DRAFT_1475013 [Coprinopsis sp. MPI-PUGE-AT-0042]
MKTDLPPSLDVRHITSYLALSRQYPLDILIDARDYEWDFLEDDVSIPGGVDCYAPPFSSSHMKTSINGPLLDHGAPLLESLSLMRCNDFISFAPEFQPACLKSPAFLSPSNNLLSRQSGPILPRIKHLALRGVHVDWTSLGAALSATRTGLYSLELGSHCTDVRPTATEFHKLLEASPCLQKLVVSGSGPSNPALHEGETDKVLLSQLKGLTLEATYPADPEEIEAGSLLTYLGSGEFHTIKESSLAVSDAAGGSQYPVKQRKDSTSSIASTSTCVGSGIEIEGRIYDDDDDMTLVDFDTKPHPPFPLLECVTLKGVRSSSSLPFSTFFGSLDRLQRLELDDMSMQAVVALGSERADSKPHALDSLGRSTSSSSSSSTPLPICPQLESLSLRNSNLQLHDLHFVLNRLVSDRAGHQTCSLASVNVHLSPSAPILSSRINLGVGSDASIGDALEAQNPVIMDKAGVAVNLFSSSQDSEHDEDESNDWEMELAENGRSAFSEGGAFNDPHFDAYYGSLLLEGETR